MKILIVTTISNTINAFLVPHVQLLREMGHRVDIACSIIDPLEASIVVQDSTIHNIPFDRKPLSTGNIKALLQVRKILGEESYDLIHTHTPVASACIRIARKRAGEPKIMYTAHGFHFYKGASRIAWLTYYPIEKLLACRTDVLVTMNAEDRELAGTRFKSTHVVQVSGVGVAIADYADQVHDCDSVRLAMGVPKEACLLLSVGELSQRKNHSVVLRAMAITGRDDIHYAICGKGPLYRDLAQLASQLGLGERVHFLGFRSDVAAVMHAADAFVFPSRQEGLPVALMEAMAVGIPILCSDIRGNRDLIEDGVGGRLFQPNDAAALARELLALPDDLELASRQRAKNRRTLRNFSLDAVLDEMRDLYEGTLMEVANR